MIKKSVLFLSWRGPGHPNFGGAEVASHEHQKTWAKLGINVTLFTSAYKGCKKVEFIDGVKIVRFGDQYFLVRLGAFVWYFLHKFDLVVDEFHGIPFYTVLYVKSKKLAYIHEVAQKVWSLNPWPFPLNIIPAISGRLIEKITFFFYRNTPFLTVSNSTKTALNNLGIKKVKVIYNGFNKFKKIKIKKTQKPTLICLSAMAKDKGTEDVVRMFAKVIAYDRKIRLMFVGKSDLNYLKYIKSLANKLNIPKDSIKYWGFVTESKKYELLASAWIQINASMCEGWGLVNLEANSVKTPVVGYNVDGTRDSVVDGKTGILCPVGRYDLMAEEVLNLVKNNKRLKTLSKASYAWSKLFSWEKSTSQSFMYIKKL